MGAGRLRNLPEIIYQASDRAQFWREEVFLLLTKASAFLNGSEAFEPGIKLPTFIGWSKKQEFQKNIYFCFIDYQSLWLCGSQQTGKFLKRWEYQTTLPASREICMQVKKQQLELDMEQQTGSK